MEWSDRRFANKGSRGVSYKDQHKKFKEKMVWMKVKGHRERESEAPLKVK